MPKFEGTGIRKDTLQDTINFLRGKIQCITACNIVNYMLEAIGRQNQQGINYAVDGTTCTGKYNIVM